LIKGKRGEIQTRNAVKGKLIRDYVGKKKR